MAMPVPVSGISSNKHMTSEYIILSMYFLSQHSDGKWVLTKIKQEVHLVSGLKANLLIGMDIMGPELINLLMSKKQATIGSAGTTIPIDHHPSGMLIC